MTSPAQHTPLESLLLLHALRSDALTAIRFSQVSEQLKKIPLIRNDPTYDSARLNEDALKHLYLGLLKDEALHHLDQNQDRKRRQPTPTLPTVEEAAKHSHLIPKLVHRLYTRYRQNVVADIQNEEAQYDRLTREISEHESAKQNDKLRDEKAAAASVPTPETRSQVQSVTEPSPAATPTPTNTAAPQTDPAPETATPTAPLQVNGDTAKDEETTAPDQSTKNVNLNRTKIDAVINHDPVSARQTASPTPSVASQHQQQQPVQKASTPTSLPPLSEMAPETSAPLPPPPQHVAAHPSHHAPAPQLPAPLQSGPGYRLSPVIQQAGFAPQFARPHGQGSPQPSHSPSPSSPRPVLPLPPGVNMPHPPPPHSPAMQNRAGPTQYPSPSQRLPPVPLQPATRPPQHIHTSPSYPQQYAPQYHQPQPQPQPQPSYGQRPPHPGGYQLPPFQVSAQDPNRGHQNHAPQQAIPPHVRPAPPTHTPTRQSGHSAYQPHTPYSHPGPHSAPHPGHARVVDAILNSLQKRSRHSTWKGARPAYLSRPYESESPAAEPISPTQTRTQLPPRKLEEAPAEQKSTEEPSPQVEEVREPTPKPVQSSRKSTRRNRAPSIASSAVASSIRARTRSHSVLSHTDNQSTNQEQPVSNPVKDEPMTPADLLQEELLAHEETPTQVKSSRQRRGNQTVQATSTSKRKRQHSISPPAEEEIDDVSVYEHPPNDKVQASRNFQRLSQVIMNDITTHKHAGPFQKPVREKDAEGYGEIIKRPQDLKSIKAAITFGARAINAATSSTDSPAATPGAGTSRDSVIVTLDKTADLVPPRAIVNSSQLEKEVMRMFANAVMFNPGDGGMVQDAREMADDIEAKVRDWRGAERQVEGRAQDDDDEVHQPLGKRRKL